MPLLEAPPLARALYHNVEIDREIPGALYGAVAQVLAWVYQLRRFQEDGGVKPDEPENLDVPPELDKGSRLRTTKPTRKPPTRLRHACNSSVICQ